MGLHASVEGPSFVHLSHSWSSVPAVPDLPTFNTLSRPPSFFCTLLPSSPCCPLQGCRFGMMADPKPLYRGDRSLLLSLLTVEAWEIYPVLRSSLGGKHFAVLFGFGSSHQSFSLLGSSTSLLSSNTPLGKTSGGAPSSPWPAALPVLFGALADRHLVPR